MAIASQIKGVEFRPRNDATNYSIYRDGEGLSLTVRFDGKLQPGQTIDIKVGRVALSLDDSNLGDHFITQIGDIQVWNWNKYVELKFAPGPTVDRIKETDLGAISITLVQDGETIDTKDRQYAVYDENSVAAPGDFVPAHFTATNQNRTTESILSPNETRLALIEIGGLWCKPTIRLAEDNAEYTQGVEADFDVKTLLRDNEDQFEAVVADAKAFADEYAIMHPVYTSGAIARIFDTDGIPAFFVVDQVTGEVVAIFKGVIDGASTAAHAYEVLAEIEAEGDTPGLERTGTARDDRIFGSVRADDLAGRGGDDHVAGGIGNDRINGGNGDDDLLGERGQDRIKGGAGMDNIVGGADSDRLTGGAAADTFVYENLSDSGVARKDRDRITDFTQGEDMIDLSAIDARDGKGNQAFTFVGTVPFSGAKGELRYSKLTDKTIVEADVDGDMVADLALALTGPMSLQESDFVL